MGTPIPDTLTTITTINPFGDEDECAYVNATDNSYISMPGVFNEESDYTLSYWTRADSNMSIVEINGETYVNEIIPKAWTKVTIGILLALPEYELRLHTLVGETCFYNVKLEKGMKPTDWTPAPEDDLDYIMSLDGRLTSAELKITDDAIVSTVKEMLLINGKNLETNFSEVNQTASEISSTVSNLSGNVSNLTQTVSGLSATVSSQDGRITTAQQTADSITLSAVKKGQSYNGMTISDSGINISGDGSFTANMTNFKIDNNGNLDVTGNLTLTEGLQIRDWQVVDHVITAARLGYGPADIFYGNKVYGVWLQDGQGHQSIGLFDKDNDCIISVRGQLHSLKDVYIGNVDVHSDLHVAGSINSVFGVTTSAISCQSLDAAESISTTGEIASNSISTNSVSGPNGVSIGGGYSPTNIKTVFCGTVVFSAQTSTDSRILITDAVMRQHLSSYDKDKCTIIANNADYGANSASVIGVSYNSGVGAWLAMLSASTGNMIRINYTAILW